MKHILLSIFISLSIANTYGQTSHSIGHLVVTITIEKRKLLSKVEIKSLVPLKDSGRIQFLEKNITESIRAGKRPKKGTYTVAVRFLTDKEGNLFEIICEKDPGFGLCAHIVRVLKKSPKWLPAAHTSAPATNPNPY